MKVGIFRKIPTGRIGLAGWSTPGRDTNRSFPRTTLVRCGYSLAVNSAPQSRPFLQRVKFLRLGRATLTNASAKEIMARVAAERARAIVCMKNHGDPLLNPSLAVTGVDPLVLARTKNPPVSDVNVLIIF